MVWGLGERYPVRASRRPSVRPILPLRPVDAYEDPAPDTDGAGGSDDAPRGWGAPAASQRVDVTPSGGDPTDGASDVPWSVRSDDARVDPQTLTASSGAGSHASVAGPHHGAHEPEHARAWLARIADGNGPGSEGGADAGHRWPVDEDLPSGFGSVAHRDAPTTGPAESSPWRFVAGPGGAGADTSAGSAEPSVTDETPSDGSVSEDVAADVPSHAAHLASEAASLGVEPALSGYDGSGGEGVPAAAEPMAEPLRSDPGGHEQRPPVPSPDGRGPAGPDTSTPEPPDERSADEPHVPHGPHEDVRTADATHAAPVATSSEPAPASAGPTATELGEAEGAVSEPEGTVSESGEAVSEPEGAALGPDGPAAGPGAANPVPSTAEAEVAPPGPDDPSVTAPDAAAATAASSAPPATSAPATPAPATPAATPGPVPGLANLRLPQRQEPTELPSTRAIVVGVANQKGGVGKTTTTVSLAAAVAQAGVRTLVVDLDPQGNATTGLGRRAEEGDPSSYGVLVEGLAVGDAVQSTEVELLDVLPSSLDLAGAEVELVPAFSRELRLRRALETVAERYDLILVDCPPSLGLLTINALVAADQVLVPIQCEYYALEGLGQLMRTVQLVGDNLNRGLELGGVVLTMYDGRTKLSQQVVDEVRAYFGEQAYETVIPRTVRLSEAPSFGQPITVFDPTSRGSRAYERLAQEVISRLGLPSSRPAEPVDGRSALDRLLGGPAPAAPADLAPEAAGEPDAPQVAAQPSGDAPAPEQPEGQP